MPLKAGFAQADITPPVGTHKIGWLRDLVSDRVLDPLHASCAVLTGGEQGIGFIQLDTLSVRWTTVQDIRQRISEHFGFPGGNVLVAATHNHAGPAVANVGDVRRDDAYVETMVEATVEAFGRALADREDAQVGFGRAFDFDIGHNRRVVMRDGTVKTHATFDDPEALFIEGPIDPEVAVMAARAKDGHMLGVVVNFACHPTHHGGDGCLTAGFPGALACDMAAAGCPATVFLNGASGNITDVDPSRGGTRMEPDQIGRILANHVTKLLPNLTYRDDLCLSCRRAMVELPFRDPGDEEIAGTIRGAQRFVDPTVYDRVIPKVIERTRRMGTQPAEVQAIFVGDRAFVGIPAEYFVEHGLRIKEEGWPLHTLVVSCANGMVGYVPHADAFRRGGYETTFTGSSRLAPEAGDILADCAIDLVRAGPSEG
ncbi:MAG: hypothetical protein JXR96_09865 [Deltaproteobacteria bacterium]|nr:hypothetical protein [Deltaproteobacteria bacterium]